MPTMTASLVARRPWETVRSSSPLIQRASPDAVAIRPSNVCAYFRTMAGRSSRGLQVIDEPEHVDHLVVELGQRRPRGPHVVHARPSSS